MGNRITNRKSYSQEGFLDNSLKMSNGLTDVFISLLALSASHLASNAAEVDFAIWLAAHDQSVVGSGTVGFDLNELPWSVDHFEAEMAFLLSVINSAKSKQYWHMLDYTPHEEWVINSLEKFQELIEDFSKEYINQENQMNDELAHQQKGEKCAIHGVYLHFAGCVICNDR